MEYDYIIGIDPGANGGIAVLDKNNKINIYKSMNLPDFDSFINTMKENKIIVFLEKLSIRPDDMNINPGKMYRIQKMMQQYSELKTVLTLQRVPYAMVHPMTWQKKLALRSQIKEDRKTRKNRYKNEAQRLFPRVKITLAIADAVLLAVFGQFILEHDINWLYLNCPILRNSVVS